MTSSTSSTSSLFNIGGLATGLDTDSIITKLMSIESAPVTQVDWNRQLWVARQSKYNDLNTKLASLSTLASTLMNPNSWTTFSGITSSNAAQVGATSTSSTPASGTYSVNVTQLASADKWTAASNLGNPTAGQVSTGTWYKGASSPVVASTLLTALKTQTNGATSIANGSTINMSYSEGGANHTVSFNVTSTSKMSDLVAFAQAQIPGSTVTLDAAGKINVQSAPGTSTEVSNLTFTATNAAGTALTAFNGTSGAHSSMVTAASNGGATAADTLSISIGGSTKYVNVAAGDTEATIANKINSTSGIGVTATLSAGKLQLTSNTTGTAQAMTISSLGTLASSLGFTNTNAATDANFTVTNTTTSGSPVSYTRGTNTGLTDVVTGVSLDLKATTGTPITLTVGQGEATADSIKQKVHDFVDQYNSIIDYVNSTTGEAKVAQPKNVTDYLAGPLANDYTFGNIAFGLENIAGNNVTGRPAGMSMLADIGISTGAITGSFDKASTTGKLVIDDTKLTAAINGNRAGVQAMLTGATGGGSTDGIVRQLSARISSLRIGGAVDAGIQGATSQISYLQSRIDDMNTHLDAKKAYYQTMFTNLETTISKMQSAFSGISGKISSLTSS